MPDVPDDVITTAMTDPGCVLVAAGLSILAAELIALADRASRRSPGEGPISPTMALVGATGSQTLRMLVTEVAASLVSAVAGCVGAAASILPFAIVQGGDPLMALAPGPPLLAVGVGATSPAAREPQRSRRRAASHGPGLPRTRASRARASTGLAWLLSRGS